MKCAVTLAHAEEIFLPRGCEGAGKEGENQSRESEVVLPGQVLHWDKHPLSLCVPVGCMFSSVQAESSISSLFLGKALPSALENPFAIGTRTQEQQVRYCQGASQRASQKSSLGFRSLSCAVSYESSRKGFHMVEEKG